MTNLRGLMVALTAGALAATGTAAAAETKVDPHATSAAIAHATGQARHHVWTAEGAPTGRLVVFLGGSRSKPGYYERFSGLAAALGNDVVDLRYPNALIAPTCPAPSRATAAALAAQDRCFTAVRGGTLFGAGSAYGSPPSPLAGWPATAGVSVADSVLNRLVSLLQHERWTRYLAAGDGRSPYGRSPAERAYPDWSRIVVTGHSQGAGHALFLAKRFGVARAALLSGPDDAPGGAATGWAAASGVTPAGRIGALRHRDEGLFCTGCDVDWDAAGITRRTVTTLKPRSGLGVVCGALNRHDSTAVDSAVALDGSGVPLLTPVWTALLTP